MNDAAKSPAVVTVEGVKVHFGAVKALDGVDLSIHPGECVGLVGHNGAGKSTIVNVINGGLSAFEGALSYGGELAHKAGVATAHANGVRCVFQELSLCPNLTIIENTRVMHRGLTGWNWRARAADIAGASLDEIFPGHSITPGQTISDLSIAERQMVEIAVAFANSGKSPKLVILDEPTSSLDASLASQLMAYVRSFVERGGSVLLISHILGEIIETSDRIVVMKDGKVVADKAAADFTHAGLVQAMGSVMRESNGAQRPVRSADRKQILTTPARKNAGLPFEAYEGEIIGLAGLGGHGQTDMLVELYLSRSNDWMPGGSDQVAFVAGDRALNGILPLWSILKNLSVASLSGMISRGMVDRRAEDTLGQTWKRRIEIRTPDTANPILSLSGGNQQKVLFARALATPARLVLMDDPMRGVDIGTKQEVYAILKAEAEAGRSFVWYSTEMDEICLCDRVYVFRDGVIVSELTGETITEENILSASFSGETA